MQLYRYPRPNYNNTINITILQKIILCLVIIDIDI